MLLATSELLTKLRKTIYWLLKLELPLSIQARSEGQQLGRRDFRPARLDHQLFWQAWISLLLILAHHLLFYSAHLVFNYEAKVGFFFQKVTTDKLDNFWGSSLYTWDLVFHSKGSRCISQVAPTTSILTFLGDLETVSFFYFQKIHNYFYLRVKICLNAGSSLMCTLSSLSFFKDYNIEI